VSRRGRAATTLFIRRARIANRHIRHTPTLNTPIDILTERLAIALRTRQLAASIGLMVALGAGRTAPPAPRAKPPGFAPYLAE
jgi:hypothetical protein